MKCRDCFFFSFDFFFFSNFREKPLVVMPDKIFSLDDPDEIEEWLEKRLLKMPASQRQKFYDLSDSRFDEKTTLGIFFTNDMNFIDESAALFPVMARVNHACQPNADFVCRPQIGKNKFRYYIYFFQNPYLKL